MRFDDGPALVITTLGTNGMGGNSGAALRAIANLTPFDVVVAASFAGSAVGMLAFWNSHQRGSN